MAEGKTVLTILKIETVIKLVTGMIVKTLLNVGILVEEVTHKAVLFLFPEYLTIFRSISLDKESQLRQVISSGYPTSMVKSPSLN